MRESLNHLTATLAMMTVASVLTSCTNSRPTGPGTHRSAEASAAPAMLSAPAFGESTPRNYPGLHNVVTYHEGFVCGGVPEGDAGFDSLVAMGIKTIISVDGAEPDLERAKARGLRYVHLPIGYNGFDDARKLELVRAQRELEKDGPIYIHCHHGKHRSAGAAATIAVSRGWMDTTQAVELMRVSGTAPNYTGLYKCTADAVPLTTDQIDAAPLDLPEISRPSSFVQAMLEVDQVTDRLKAIERANWQTPQDHPDLVPAAEAGRLADLLRVLAHGDRAQNKPEHFAEMLRQNAASAQSLEDLLVAGQADPKALSAQLAQVSASCKACHTAFRD